MRRRSQAYVSARLSPAPYTRFRDLAADNASRVNHHSDTCHRVSLLLLPTRLALKAAPSAAFFSSRPIQPARVVVSCPMDSEREDFAGKLLLIEKQASLCAHDLPPGLFRDRIEEIAMTAKLLRARLDVAAAAILPAAKTKKA